MAWTDGSRAWPTPAATSAGNSIRSPMSSPLEWPPRCWHTCGDFACCLPCPPWRFAERPGPGPARQTRRGGQFSVPGGGGEPAGAVQHHQQSAALQSRASRQEILCGHADSGRGGGGGRGGPSLAGIAAPLDGRRPGLAGAGAHGGLPDGEHVALLQFQRHSLQYAPAFPAGCLAGRAVCADLVLLALGPFRHCAHLHVFRRMVAAAVDHPPPSIPAGAARVRGGIPDIMSSPLKPAPVPTMDSVRAKPYRVAIVGAASLRGKEVAEVLNDRNFPAVDVKLLDDDESLGQLETMGEEVTFIQRVRNEQFEHLDFTFFASDPNSTRKSWKAARDAGSAIVDLSYALEEEPGATIRSSWT